MVASSRRIGVSNAQLQQIKMRTDYLAQLANGCDQLGGCAIIDKHHVIIDTRLFQVTKREDTDNAMPPIPTPPVKKLDPGPPEPERRAMLKQPKPRKPVPKKP